MRWVFIIAIAFLCLGAVERARADYRSEYDLYLAAIDAGDLVSAVKHAEAAWRAAEVELGDHGTTAILALNYANLIGPYDPAKALDAYERAASLTRAGKAALDTVELELRIAEIRLLLDIDSWSRADQLEKLLTDATTSSASPVEAVARGGKRWPHIACARGIILRQRNQPT